MISKSLILKICTFSTTNKTLCETTSLPVWNDYQRSIKFSICLMIYFADEDISWHLFIKYNLVTSKNRSRLLWWVVVSSVDSLLCLAFLILSHFKTACPWIEKSFLVTLIKRLKWKRSSIFWGHMHRLEHFWKTLLSWSHYVNRLHKVDEIASHDKVFVRLCQNCTNVHADIQIFGYGRPDPHSFVIYGSGIPANENLTDMIRTSFD